MIASTPATKTIMQAKKIALALLAVSVAMACGTEGADAPPPGGPSRDDGGRAEAPTATPASPGALDAATTDHDSPPVDGSVFDASMAMGCLAGPITESAALPKESMLASCDSAWFETIAVDATDIYGGGRGGVVRLPKGGGLPLVIAPRPATFAATFDMIVDATAIYDIVELGGSKARTVSKSGGAPSVIFDAATAGADARIWGLAGDDAYVYLAVADLKAQPNNGTVVRCHKTTHAVDVVATGLSQPGSLAVDDAFVYVASFGAGIFRFAKSGGAGVQLVASDPARLGRVVVDSTYVYWVNRGTFPGEEDGSIKRTPKIGGGPTQRMASSVKHSNKELMVFGGTVAFFAMSAAGLSPTPGDPLSEPRLLSATATGSVSELTSPRLIASSFPGRIVIDATGTYWAERTAVRRIVP